jgi:hypothetical protein
MMAQINMLLRIKQNKEEQALRHLQHQRRRVAESARAVDEARAVLDASVRALSSRQDAVYQKILNRRVAMTDIEVANGALMEIDRAHDLLVSATDRAVYVHEQAEAEFVGCLDAHRQAIRSRDKYATLADESRAQFDERQAQREEIEAEESFSSRLRRST